MSVASQVEVGCIRILIGSGILDGLSIRVFSRV